MENMVVMRGGEPTTSSKMVADAFGKTHQEVRRCIEAMNCSDDFRSRNFTTSTYKSPQNKEFKCYEMTKDGFCFLAMGFGGKKAAKWKEAYIKAFNEMESYIKNDIGAPSLIDAINEASKHIDLIAEQGSNWGKAGHQIRKNKKQAVERLSDLMSQAQMQLAFTIK